MHLDGNESHGEKENLAYGCRSCNNRLAAAFKRAGIGVPTNQYNPARGGIPTFEQYMWAVTHHSRGEHDEGGAVIHATPKSKRIEYAQRIADAKRGRGEAEDRWNPTRKNGFFSPTSTHYKRSGLNWSKAEDREQLRTEREREKADAANQKFLKLEKARDEKATAAADKARDRAELRAERAQERADIRKERAEERAASGGARAKKGEEPDARQSYWEKAVLGADKKKMKAYLDSGKGSIADFLAQNPAIKRRAMKRCNPAAASAEVFEEFHGFPPSEVITVTKKIHHHEHLAAAGKLTSLEVWGVDGQGHHIGRFGGAFLAFNEKKNQLFVEGGDQSVNLGDYGIKRPHELETLGTLTDIGYQTNKTHLGDEGGDAVYVHKFRSTNENGKHVVVKIARYPDLIYDVVNESLLFSGGSYEILREGIDK
jgi:hypothetical protein